MSSGLLIQFLKRQPVFREKRGTRERKVPIAVRSCNRFEPRLGNLLSISFYFQLEKKNQIWDNVRVQRAAVLSFQHLLLWL